MRHEAALDAPHSAGGTKRSHLRAAARMGAPRAVRALANPYRYPESLRYLHDIAQALHGRSGLSGAGVNPLSPVVLASWLDAEGRTLSALEREAVMVIDVALAYRGEGAI